MARRRMMNENNNINNNVDLDRRFSLPRISHHYNEHIHGYTLRHEQDWTCSSFTQIRVTDLDFYTLRVVGSSRIDSSESNFLGMIGIHWKSTSSSTPWMITCLHLVNLPPHRNLCPRVSHLKKATLAAFPGCQRTMKRGTWLHLLRGYARLLSVLVHVTAMWVHGWIRWDTKRTWRMAMKSSSRIAG